ncbi:hypothetical protein ACN27F_02760 [Solwaraspora sp. WMMB335]|uniref:hypothetical protein n=1 Tax=Solwaraspora sp. WMMB335 TaxID=3404118 RepID=UPI003B9281B0
MTINGVRDGSVTAMSRTVASSLAVLSTTPVPAAAETFAALAFSMAGRLADDVRAVLRTHIADDAVAQAGALLAEALADGEVELTAHETELARQCLSAAGVDSRWLPAGGAPAAPTTPAMPEYRFSPAPDGPAPELLAAATSVVGWTPGLHGLWQTLRTSRRATAEPVWLAEATVDADLVELTAEIQHRLAAAGEVPPRVEVFTPQTALTDYHRRALDRAGLVWLAPELPELQVARVYDGADPDGSPYFTPHHPHTTGPERDRLLAYLEGATVVLADIADGADVLEPESGRAVPMAFRTDGTWVWTDAIAYYLRQHGLAPEPGLAGHVLAATGRPSAASPLTVARALVAVADPEFDEPARLTRWV